MITMLVTVAKLREISSDEVPASFVFWFFSIFAVVLFFLLIWPRKYNNDRRNRHDR